MIAQDILHLLKQINADLAMSSAKLYQKSTVILIQIIEIEYNHDKNKRKSAKNSTCPNLMGIMIVSGSDREIMLQRTITFGTEIPLLVTTHLENS
jgi:hypothetical protein